MKIAYLNPQPVPDTLPSTLQVLQFADALAEIGHEVHLVTPSPGRDIAAAVLLGRQPSSSLHFHHLKDRRRSWYFPSSSNRLFHVAARRWLGRQAIDAVYLRNLKLAESLFAARCPTPIFFETHELFAQSFHESHAESFTHRRKLRKIESREQAIYKAVAGIVPITAALLADIRTTYGVATPALVAPDGVDLSLAEAALQRPRVANDPPVVLYLGSLHPWKGVETLIAAMAAVPGAVLEIVGGTAERIAQLTAAANATPAAGRIRFAGPVAPAGRFHVIAAADICVLPLTETSIASRYTSPLKLFEYMAMGKAIVAADVASLREVLTHDRNALLAEVGRPEATAAALNALIADMPRRHRLGEQARADAAQYAWTARAIRVAGWMAEQMGRCA